MVDMGEFFAISSVVIKLPVSVCAEAQERVSSVTKMVSIAFEACSEAQHGQKGIEIKTRLLKHAPSSCNPRYSLQRKSQDLPCFDWMGENRDL